MSSKKSFFKRQSLAILIVALLASCASTKTSTDENAPELATSESDVLNDSEKVSSTDSDVFADLKSGEAAGTTESATPIDSSELPFYNTIGGESLGRIAYTLYGSKSFAKTLAKNNPEYAAVKKLDANQKVYFDFANTNPQAKFLTKDLIDRYAAPLSDRIQAKGSESGLVKTTITVGAGETLQAVAHRLYGTSRYWPEIYLLNHDKIEGYDKVRAGATLTVYQRDASAPVADTTNNSHGGEGAIQPVLPITDANTRLSEPNTSVATPMNIQTPSEPVMPAVEPTNIPDPIPETPVTSVPAAKPAVEATQPASEDLTDLGNPTTRRALYFSLVILIAGLAFMLTKKKKKPFDMLDATSRETTGRSKLSDGHNKIVG